MTSACLVVALYSAAVVKLAAQEPPPRAVAAPIAVLNALAGASSVVERDDGSALVVLFERGELAQLAPTSRAITMLPFRGAFGRAMALAGGQIGVARTSQQDVLVLDAQGRAVDSLKTPIASGTFVIGVNAAVAVFDADHRRYQVGGSRANPDAPLLRFDGEHSTTITSLRQQAPARITIGGGGTSAAAGRAFEPIDAWALAPDGRVAVVRGRDYRVQWFSASGDSIVGPINPVAPVAVSDAHKAAFRAEQQASLNNARKMMGGTLGDAAMNSPEPVWPDAMPAVRGNTLVLGADGTLWVPRHSAPSSDTNVWDAFDAQGVRRARVAIPTEWKLVGAGRGRLYAAGAKGLAVFAEP